GCDVSRDALALARENAETHSLDVTFVESDLLTAVTCPDGGWDLIVANLPYIPSLDIESLAPEVRSYEPLLALDGGPDGLDLIRRLLQEARVEGVLRPEGALFLEFGIHQADELKRLVLGMGFSCHLRDDLGGIPRVAWVRR
ncbi:MAG: N5-glutamine methyltransferase family protein, partial [Nannocystaceae bacterium]